MIRDKEGRLRRVGGWGRVYSTGQVCTVKVIDRSQDLSWTLEKKKSFYNWGTRTTALRVSFSLVEYFTQAWSKGHDITLHLVHTNKRTRRGRGRGGGHNGRPLAFQDLTTPVKCKISVEQSTKTLGWDLFQSGFLKEVTAPTCGQIKEKKCFVQNFQKARWENR